MYSPIPSANERKKAEEIPPLAAGTITRTIVAGQEAPKLRLASTNVLRGIDESELSRTLKVNGRARITKKKTSSNCEF